MRSLAIVTLLVAGQAFAAREVAAIIDTTVEKPISHHETLAGDIDYYLNIYGAANGQKLTQDGKNIDPVPDKATCPGDKDRGEPEACFKLNKLSAKTSTLEYSTPGKKWNLSFKQPEKSEEKASSLMANTKTAVTTALLTKLGLPEDFTPEAYYRGDEAVLLFNSAGEPLLPPHPQVDEDDTVRVVVVAGPDESIEQLDLVKCSAAKTLRVGGSLPNSSVVLTGANDKEVRERSESQQVTATKCSSDDGIQIKAKVKKGTTTSETNFTVSTIALYRITVALGLLYDFSHSVEYRASALKGESVPVINRDEHAVGPSAVALISFRICKVDSVRLRFRKNGYAWCGIFANPTLGVSLSAPFEHIYFGFHFEPYSGFGVVWGGHLFQVPNLAAGYNEGDRFDNGGQVPVDKRWTGIGFFVGLAIDSTVFTAITSLLNR